MALNELRRRTGLNALHVAGENAPPGHVPYLWRGDDAVLPGFFGYRLLPAVARSRGEKEAGMVPGARMLFRLIRPRELSNRRR